MAKYSRSCSVKGRDGRYYLIKESTKNCRVLKIGASEHESELVESTLVEDIQPVSTIQSRTTGSQFGGNDANLFRLCHEDLKATVPGNASWDWFVWFAINNAFSLMRDAPGAYKGDVFKDRDELRYPNCTQEEHWVANLFHTAREKTDGVLEINDEPIWLLGFQWPNQAEERGRRADLVGITLEGGLVVFEFKLASNLAEPPAMAIPQALDYLSHLCRVDNFSKILNGFQAWRNKPGQIAPEYFKSILPDRDQRPMAVVLAPQQYYDHHLKNTGWPKYLEMPTHGPERLGVRMKLAVCDFSQPAAKWFLPR